MNVGNILKVADAIEQASVPGLGFNLRLPYRKVLGEDCSGRSCGTVACIAGWAAVVEGHAITTTTSWGGDILPWAQLYFGLNDREAGDLMAPLSIILFGRLPMPTDKQAVRCLRNLAITGKVDWEAAMKGDEPALPPLPVSKSLTVTA